MSFFWILLATKTTWRCWRWSKWDLHVHSWHWTTHWVGRRPHTSIILRDKMFKKKNIQHTVRASKQSYKNFKKIWFCWVHRFQCFVLYSHIMHKTWLDCQRQITKDTSLYHKWVMTIIATNSRKVTFHPVWKYSYITTKSKPKCTAVSFTIAITRCRN